MMGYNNGWNMMSGFGWWGIYAPFFWVVVATIIILLLIFVSHNKSEANQPLKREKSALDILKERYARGEIKKSEFEEKRKDLA